MKVKGAGDTIRLSPSAEEISRQGILNYLNENNTFVFVGAVAKMAFREGPEQNKPARFRWISQLTDVNEKLSIHIEPCQDLESHSSHKKKLYNKQPLAGEMHRQTQ